MLDRLARGVAERDLASEASATGPNTDEFINSCIYADMAELVDALASGASVRKYVEVQVLLSAPKMD
jgi:hypothetical protein